MPGTILIVDDSDVAREAIRTWLDVMFPSQQIIEAASGEEAVAVAENRAVDVILMDIGLPGMTGICATRCIRDSGTPVPVVMLTMHEDPMYQEAALAAGANAFVPKRRMAAELQPLLKKWLPIERPLDDDSDR